MKKNTLTKLAVSSAAVLALFAIGATAQADNLYNTPTGSATGATLVIGVNPEGHLNAAPNVTVNASATGLAYKFADGAFHDATAPGCLCEGWGVSANGVSGYANVSTDGVQNLTVDSFSPLATSITSNVHVTTMPGLSVSQVYTTSSATSSAFRDHVTITNTSGGTLTNVRYVRVMDWDIPPTEFSELVTIKGTGTTTLLEQSHDNGFATANPLAATSGILQGSGDFTDSGPADHGAYFKFNFGTLADLASYSFDIFYGAAGSEVDALAALALIGPELYSLGESAGHGADGTPVTFFFGFKGVGGSVITPTPGVPEPATLALLGLGLLGFAATRSRRTRS